MPTGCRRRTFQLADEDALVGVLAILEVELIPGPAADGEPLALIAPAATGAQTQTQSGQADSVFANFSATTPGASVVVVVYPPQATQDEVDALVDRKCSEARGEIRAVVRIPDNGRSPEP